MKKYLSFLSFWLLGSLFLYLATFFYPANFELGNFWITPLAATFWAGFWITVLVWAAKPVLTKLNLKLKGRVKMFLFYWLCNSAAIWIIARFAHLTGFGISRYCWAIGLGFVMNIAQWGLWQGLKAANLAKK